MTMRPILVLPTSGSIYNEGITFELIESLLETAHILRKGELLLTDGPPGVICDYRSSKLRIQELRSYGSSPSRLVIFLPRRTPIQIAAYFGIQGDPNDVEMRRPAPYAAKEISEGLIRIIDAMVFHTEPALPIKGLDEDPINPHHFTDIIGENIATLLRARHREPKRIAIKAGHKIMSILDLDEVCYGAEYEFSGDDGEPTSEGIFASVPAVAHLKQTYDRNWLLQAANLEGFGSDSSVDAMMSIDFITKLRAILDNSLPWNSDLI